MAPRASAVAVLLVVVIVGACSQSGAPPPRPTPATDYPALVAVVRAMVEFHVDSPSSKAVLEPVTRSVIAAAGQRTFDLGAVDVPSYTGELDADLGRATSVLTEIRRRAPSISATELETLAIDAALRSNGDCRPSFVPSGAVALAPTGFSGIGATILSGSAETASLPWIRNVRPDGPAERAGIRDGDRIRSLNGRSVAGLSDVETAALIRGADGSALDIVVVGPSGERSYHVIRAPIPAADVIARTIDKNIGYVSVQDPFTDPASIRAVLDRWNASGVTGWVLDLRAGGRGRAAAWAGIASAFVASGLLWVRADRGGFMTEVATDGSAPAVQRPLAVLVDETTNSLSLAVASALRERGRARSFGGPVAGCVELGTERPVPGGTVFFTESRLLSVATREPLRTVPVDEPRRRGSDGTDLPLAAAVAWLKVQR